jgi:hypothetical protein
MKKYIVFDSETTNSINDPFCYDIGFIVIDETGKVYEKHSYVVADVFLDSELMASAYFADKIPQYWEDIKTGKRILRRLKTIRSILRDVMTQHEINMICAYNCAFDVRSGNYTQRYLTSSKYRYFYPYGTQFMDILKLAREILKTDENYKTFCKENNYLTEKGQSRYTAEVVYRYLFDKDFVEEHTGLADCLIEAQIMVKLMEENPNVDFKLW